MGYSLAYCAPRPIDGEPIDLNCSIYLDWDMANLSVTELKEMIEQALMAQNIDDTVSTINFKANIMDDGVNLDLTQLPVFS